MVSFFYESGGIAMIKIEECYDIKTIDKKILESNSIIERNIDKYSNDERGFLSQNVLAQLRTFTEYIGLKIYLDWNNNYNELQYNDNTISDVMNYIKGKGNIKFIERFHYYLQITKSHYIEDDDGAERLMLKYYKFLIQLKELIKSKYNLSLLNNITKFPVNLDKTFSEYYKKISNILDRIKIDNSLKLDSDKYYVQKIKPFFINGKIYYEVTLTIASNKSNKFDRMIAFTKINLSLNYAIKISTRKETINIFGRDTQINIINNWFVSIRGCEIINFAKILGLKINSYNTNNNKEYWEFMKLLTYDNYTLYDLAILDNENYSKIKKIINQKTTIKTIQTIIDKCRYFIEKGMSGSNILKYLLYTFNNKIIKDQYNNESCSKLSSLFLKWGCLPFEQMPFCSSLINHNPKMNDLYNIFNPITREHEILASIIKKNTESKNNLYTPIDKLKNFNNLSCLVNNYNKQLYYKHIDSRSLIIEGNYIYLNGYEADTIDILNKLINLSKVGICGYKSSFQYFMDNEKYEIDDVDKKRILLNMYENSRVSLVYGAAGTGKSTLIKHLCNFYKNNSILCLANTNPAIENLKRNILTDNADYMTIYSFLSEYNHNVDYDILIIDECSTVSNSDMKQVLNKCNFGLLLLVGDIYQIESISFGNWFNIAKTTVDGNSVHELNMTWRSKEKKLLDLWEMVRTGDDRLDEMLTKNCFSSPIDNTILKKTSEDEIILCLNYDGLYGINNINNYLQNINPKRGVSLNINTYKIGDPIIFGDTTRFLPLIYNNMKGIINNIEEDENKVWFTIEINKVINELEIRNIDLELVNVTEKKSLVKFYVDKYKNVDDDDDDYDSTWVVPFSIAYAVSIHKSQGLEYESVKILLTNEIDDLITHNIFYTAITRAKRNLKIYWSPECQNKIISTIKHIDDGKDACIIKNKLTF